MEIAVVLGLLGLAILFLLYYATALMIRLLAERNLFWTLVEEGTAKAIMRNGRFTFCVMSYNGYRFAADAPEPPLDEVEKWAVVPFPPSAAATSRRYLPLLKNIRWIGLPPFSDAHGYRFSWTSLEEREDDSGLKKNFHFKELPIDYILLQEDVYVSKIEEVECKDNIPLDSVILVGGYIINPYKALFRVERWLEASLNLVGAKMRDFFGERTYAQLRQLAQPQGGDMPAEFATYFNQVIAEILKDWGFKITFIRIHSIDPGSELAADFIRATTQLYVAEQKALADEAEGRGLAARDRQQLEAVSKIPGGIDMFKYKQIAESKLTTYVEGGAGVMPSIPLGGGNPPPPPPNNQQPGPTPSAGP